MRLFHFLAAWCLAPFRGLASFLAGVVVMLAIGLAVLVLAAVAAAGGGLIGVGFIVIGPVLQLRKLLPASPRVPDAVNRMTIADQAWVAHFVRLAARAGGVGQGRGPGVTAPTLAE